MLEKLEPALRRWHALARFVWRQFGQDQCLSSAGMLTYTTLLSLVPLLIVVLSTVSAMPGVEKWNVQIQDFLFRYFLPEAQESIAERLESLTQGRGGLTATMGVFLIVTSLILMSNIENALNRIWGVRTARSLAGKFVVYWSMLTLGPVLLGASLALSSYFFSLDILIQAQQQSAVRAVLETLTPYVVGALAFFLLFVIVPNRKVPWRHAILGALITAILFEVTKKGFGLYIRTFDSYSVLYGALGSIPIFLVWIYLAWSVILLGASLTASLDSFRYREPGKLWPTREEFELLYRIVGHLWRGQREGRGSSVPHLLAKESGADDHQIQQLLENLRLARMVRRDDEGDWLLVRDLAEVSVGDLYATGDYVWPMDGLRRSSRDRWQSALAELLEQTQSPLAAVLDMPLKQLYSESESAGGSGAECRRR
jgi:membrane protein